MSQLRGGSVFDSSGESRKLVIWLKLRPAKESKSELYDFPKSARIQTTAIICK